MSKFLEFEKKGVQKTWVVALSAGHTDWTRNQVLTVAADLKEDDTKKTTLRVAAVKKPCTKTDWALARQHPDRIIPAKLIGRSYSSNVWQLKDPPESIDHRVEGHVQCQQEEADILLKTSGKQPEGGVRFFVQRLIKDINEIRNILEFQ